MKLLKYKYRQDFFKICLKVTRLNIHNHSKLLIQSQEHKIKANQILITIKSILKIKNISFEEKARLNYIISNYDIYSYSKKLLFINKYMQKFIYEYKKFNKHTKISTYTKKKTVDNIIVLIYLYTSYKLLKSHNPLFIYLSLIKKCTILKNSFN